MVARREIGSGERTLFIIYKLLEAGLIVSSDFDAKSQSRFTEKYGQNTQLELNGYKAQDRRRVPSRSNVCRPPMNITLITGK